MSSKYATAGTLLLAILLFGRAIVTFGPMLVSNVRNGAVWTPLSELIAMSGASLFLSGMASGSSSTVRIPDRVGRWSRVVGPMLFGGPLIVFGIEHFVYARYVATLVPAWIPGHLFWTYLVGVTFIVAAAAILLPTVGVVARSAGIAHNPLRTVGDQAVAVVACRRDVLELFIGRQLLIHRRERNS